MVVMTMESVSVAQARPSSDRTQLALLSALAEAPDMERFKVPKRADLRVTLDRDPVALL